MTDLKRQSHWTWEEIEAILKIKIQRNKVSDVDLVQAQDVLGHKLPSSYVHYARRWGSGVAFGLFVILVPDVNPHLDIRVRVRELRHLIRLNIQMGLWDKSLVDLVQRLSPFGESENGDILCWDPRRILPDGEMPIYFLDSEQSHAAHVGNSILSFLGDYCLDGKLNEVIPFGGGQKWNLPATFNSY